MPADLRLLLSDAIKHKASDLSISAGLPPAMRIDGELRYLEDFGRLSNSDVEQSLQMVLTAEQMEKYRQSSELDFSFSYIGADKSRARCRGNVYLESGNMAAAFRLLPMRVRSIDELRLPLILKEVSKRRRGLFLVTGPTGHGKSTTLAAMVNEINNTRQEHIITIEDPVEYVYRSARCLIHQREVGFDTASFAEGLRRALRQDPDVIMIGELRDLETINAALTAAETGHLVFGTLHTHGAAQSIDRIVDVFSPDQQMQIRVQLATVLVGICSQQLIPKGKEYGGGRVCATEIMLATSAVKNCIREDNTFQIKDIIQTGANVGMHTMEQSLAGLVQNKMLPRSTALTFAFDPKDLQRIIKVGPQALSSLQAGARNKYLRSSGRTFRFMRPKSQ